jgi:hypothetical protein
MRQLDDETCSLEVPLPSTSVMTVMTPTESLGRGSECDEDEDQGNGDWETHNNEVDRSIDGSEVELLEDIENKNTSDCGSVLTKSEDVSTEHQVCPSDGLIFALQLTQDYRSSSEQPSCSCSKPNFKQSGKRPQA